MNVDDLRRDGYFRAGASLTMWVFAAAAFFMGLIEVRHIVVASAAVAYLVLIGFPVVAVARRVTTLPAYSRFVVVISVIEVVGYSAVIYALGGPEATYLLAIYVIYVAYMGIVEHRESPYLSAAMCSVMYDLMLVLQNLRILPSMQTYSGFALPLERQAIIALALTTFLFITAYMSAFASRAIKDMKRKLTEQNLELERRVQERTAALTLEVEERRRAEEAISASLKEKDVLLKEIHHRVKNNLQVVSSLLSLQSGFVKSPETRAMFAESQARVRSMALVHEKLYQSRGLDRIDFADYLRSLVADLYRSWGSRSGAVSYTVDAEEVSIAIDKAIPCGLIVNELFTNALKHAFPDGRTGEVAVSLHAAPQGILELVIRDDGIGLPASLDLKRTESLGMQLVDTLVQQLGGTIETSGTCGTTFTIHFSLDRP